MNRETLRKWMIAFVAALGAIIGVHKLPPQNVPAPTPAATATVTPTPVAVPSALPTATPTATPDLPACESLPDCGSRCCTAGGVNPFADEIRAAQERIELSHPEHFDRDGSLKISETQYTDLLAAGIRSWGLCTRGGGIGSTSKDEVGIKRPGESFSVNVDVILGATNTPHIGGVYTCRPASF